MSNNLTVNCSKCGSYIHTTERCYVWIFKPFCNTDNIFKNNCDCNECKKNCKFCNSTGCGHDGTRCSVCNEYLVNGLCQWDHQVPLCKFCNLPTSRIIYRGIRTCDGGHDMCSELCSECNIPQTYNSTGPHNHDGNKCIICGSLLNDGRCIYRCVGGGIFCEHCGYEGVCNNVCGYCFKKVIS